MIREGDLGEGKRRDPWNQERRIKLKKTKPIPKLIFPEVEAAFKTKRNGTNGQNGARSQRPRKIRSARADLEALEQLVTESREIFSP